MTEIRFYHLEKNTIFNMLPRLCEKVLMMQKKCRLVVPNEYHEQFSNALWENASASSFNVHEVVSGQDTTHTAVLAISAEPGLDDIRFLWGNISEEYLENASVICYIFDGKDEMALQNARNNWVQWSKEDVYSVVYYKQNATGQWQKKA